MSILFTLHFSSEIVETFVRFLHVCECVHVQIRYFQFSETVIIDRLEAKLEYDAFVFGIHEEFSHIHSELSFGLFLSIRIDVFSCYFVNNLELSSYRRTLGLPIVVHKLQNVLVLLLHLSIITRMPRHQIQRQGHGAIIGSCNATQLLEKVNCDGRLSANSTVWWAAKPEDIVNVIVHVHVQVVLGWVS